MRAPLQLEQSYFLKLGIEANLDYQTGEEADDEIDFGLKVEVAPHPEDENRYQIMLTLDEFRSSGPALPYDIDIKIVGFFKMAKEFEHDNKEHLTQVNGATMLYGAAREQVLSITGRGPFGPYQIPTVNFFDLIPRPDNPGTTLDKHS